MMPLFKSVLTSSLESKISTFLIKGNCLGKFPFSLGHLRMQSSCRQGNSLPSHSSEIHSSHSNIPSNVKVFRDLNSIFGQQKWGPTFFILSIPSKISICRQTKQLCTLNVDLRWPSPFKRLSSSALVLSLRTRDSYIGSDKEVENNKEKEDRDDLESETYEKENKH